MVFHMKTTVELPEDLYRETKALAALTGRTLKELIREALRERLERERGARGPHGWRSAFGKVDPADARRVQAVIDDELSGVDPTEWR